MSKRIVALLLALLMIFATMSVAFAATKNSGATGAGRAMTFNVKKSIWGSITMSRRTVGIFHYGAGDIEDWGRYKVTVYKVNSDGSLTKKSTSTVNLTSDYDGKVVLYWGAGTFKVRVEPADVGNTVVYKYLNTYSDTGSWKTLPTYNIKY